jgi:hypothetical protein
MTPNELLDDGLRRGGLPGIEEAGQIGWIDRAVSFEKAHFLEGFPQPDGRFHFRADWKAVGPQHARMAEMVDHSNDFERATEVAPFKLVPRLAISSTAPSPRRRRRIRRNAARASASIPRRPRAMVSNRPHGFGSATTVGRSCSKRSSTAGSSPTR